MPLVPQIFAQVDPSGFNMREFVDALARTPLSKITIIAVVCTLIRIAIFKPMMSTPRHKRIGPLHMLINFLNEGCDLLVYAAVFVFLLIRPFFGQTFVIPSGSMWSTLHVGDYIGINKSIYRHSDPKRGDIVVFKPPLTAIINPQKDLDKDGEPKIDLIKRCIGTPGDTVELRKNQLYVNGTKVDESYIHYSRQIPENPDEFAEFSKEERDQTVRVFDFKIVSYKGKYIPVMSENGILYSSDTPEQLRLPLEESDKLLALPPAKIPDGFYLFMGDNRNNSYDSRFWGLVPRDNIVGRSEFIWLPFSRIGSTR